jgi:hypothetical protein
MPSFLMERLFFLFIIFFYFHVCGLLDVCMWHREEAWLLLWTVHDYSGISIAIKACATENLDVGCANGNICILANNQAVNKTLYNYQINSEMALAVISPW